MSKEICISSTPHETRLAILEDEQLTEVYYERENEYTLAGSIYKGRLPVCFRECSPHLSTWAWSGTLFSMSPTLWRSRKTLLNSSAFPGTGKRPRAANHKTARHVPLMRQGRKRSRRPGATAPRQVLLQFPAVSRLASLRMEPVVGGDAGAAARASGHRKAGSRQVRNKLLRAARGTPAGRVTGRTRGHREAPTCGVCSSG